ncbi:hypothetical protein, partial [Pseudomonas syringae]
GDEFDAMALTGQHFNFHRLLLGQHIGSSKPPVLPRGVNSRLALGGHFYSGGDRYLDVIGYSAIKKPLGGGFNQIFSVESLCSILTKRLVSLYALFGTGIYHAESILPHLLHAAGNGSFVFFGDFPNFIYSL